MPAGVPGRKELRSIRLKSETTNGSPVAPRFLWRGNGEMPKDDREIVFVEQQVGIFGGVDDTYTPKLMAHLDLADTEATFEQLPDLFMMAGLGTSGGGNRAGSAQGASGSSVIFTLPVPTSSGPITYSYTAEAGDDAEAEFIPYVLADEIKLSWKGGEAMKVSASLMGRYVQRTNAVGSFSAVGTLPSVEYILSSGSVWLTPSGSGFGTGLMPSGNLLEGELTFKPVWTPKFPVDSGTTYFHTAVFTGMEIEGQFTFEHQATGTYSGAGSTGQKQKYRDMLPQLARLEWPGSTITEGTTITNKLLRIDLPIKYSEIEALDDIDGNDVLSMSFLSKYNVNTAAAGRGTVTIVRQGTSEFAGA